jgi:L-2,4-diaminobutyrate decarboxylase
LYQPKGVGAILFRDTATAHAALSFGAGYLSAPNIGVVGTAPASALPLAATLLAWGRQGLASRIEGDLEKAQALCQLVSQDERFELWTGAGCGSTGAGAGATGVVVWRPRDVPAAEVRDRLRGAWVSLTDIDGERWLRCVSANPSADPELVFAAVVAALER